MAGVWGNLFGFILLRLREQKAIVPSPLCRKTIQYIVTLKLLLCVYIKWL